MSERDRRIWFARHPDGGGVYQPVTREGRLTFALAVLGVLTCGIGGMVAFVLTLSWWCFPAMFVVGAAGLAVFARTVARHS